MAEGNQNQLVLSVVDIKKQIESLYTEMKSDDIIKEDLERTKVTKIKKLRDYYLSLLEAGQFKDEDTGRPKDKHEICRTILEEMDKRDFSQWSKASVWYALSDDYKRAWRKPITNNGKLQSSSLLNPETDIIYNQYMDHINELFEFDYNELPKSLQISIGEHFFKCYKKHNDEWLKLGITLVKHEQDTHDASKGDPIRIETHRGGGGELYHAMVELKEVIDECLPVVESHPPEDLAKEHKYANAVRGLTAYFIPWKNSKWKKDWGGWIEIHVEQVNLGLNQVLPNSQRFISHQLRKGLMHGRELPEKPVDKNRPRILRFARDFTKNFPYLADLSEYLVTEIEPVRAIHTIKLHPKMSEAAFT